MPFDRVSKRQLRVELVFISPSDSYARKVAISDQVGNDALRGALGYANPFGHVAEPDLGVTRNAQQHMRVIGQEGPSGHT